MNTIKNYARLLIAVLAAAGSATPTQESTGEYLDDTAITTKVEATLLTMIQRWVVSPSTWKPTKAQVS